MAIVLDGTTGITTPELDSSGPVTSNGVTTSLYPLVSGTAVASTSGTSIDFTGIPSWVKRITVMFNGVSTNGTTAYLIQIGSGSVTTTGYVSSSTNLVSSSPIGVASSTAGFIHQSYSAAFTHSGSFILTNISGNTWVAQGAAKADTLAMILTAGNSPALSGPLDRVRITTVNGTDTFDAGSINIMYE